MKVNAVFEGGGVRAIGLVGAVHEAERRGIQFHQVAGTSSGAIVASFLAAGYKADAMEKMIQQTPFSHFLVRSPIFNAKLFGPAARLLIKKGLYSGEALEQWVSQKLAAKGIRTFGDLKPNSLRIIASDISQGKLLVLPDDIEQYGINPAKFPVAKAVRMSTSIPYFFDPVVIRKPVTMRSKDDDFFSQFIYIVDGGLLSNFPLWIFDKPEIQQGQSIPTIGFQLVGRQHKKPRNIRGPLTMLTALFATMMDAHDERYISQNNDFRTIKIPTLGVQATDFHIDLKSGSKLFNSGRSAASSFFDKWSMEQYENYYFEYVLRRKKKK